MIIGFGSGRGYEFVDFESDAIEAGLVIQQRYSTWNFHLPADDFLVAVLGRK